MHINCILRIAAILCTQDLGNKQEGKVYGDISISFQNHCQIRRFDNDFVLRMVCSSEYASFYISLNCRLEMDSFSSTVHETSGVTISPRGMLCAILSLQYCYCIKDIFLGCYKYEDANKTAPASRL